MPVPVPPTIPILSEFNVNSAEMGASKSKKLSTEHKRRSKTSLRYIPNSCSVEMVKSNKSFNTTSSCIRQHPFSYGFAKKYSAATPSTNIPISCALCSIIPPRKLPPVFWKYSIYSHIQEKHPRFWDDVDGAPCNLEKDFANKIAISAEELQKLGVFIGFTSAPSAQSLLSGKRTLDGDAGLGQGRSKRHKT
ncbi:hypothetical protein C8J57DRAFT_1230606 [Mycena rebaudengoi]|nr:hypothetical protein C8J57DRAFT_1230606 [Mycena rebaudengoi]